MVVGPGLSLENIRGAFWKNAWERPEFCATIQLVPFFESFSSPISWMVSSLLFFIHCKWLAVQKPIVMGQYVCCASFIMIHHVIQRAAQLPSSFPAFLAARASWAVYPISYVPPKNCSLHIVLYHVNSTVLHTVHCTVLATAHCRADWRLFSSVPPIPPAAHKTVSQGGEAQHWSAILSSLYTAHSILYTCTAHSTLHTLHLYYTLHTTPSTHHSANIADYSADQ